MTSIVVLMLVSLLVAGGVAFYAAYPDRRRRVPGVPWLGEAVERAADAVPTVDAEHVDSDHADDHHDGHQGERADEHWRLSWK